MEPAKRELPAPTSFWSSYWGTAEPGSADRGYQSADRGYQSAGHRRRFEHRHVYTRYKTDYRDIGGRNLPLTSSHGNSRGVISIATLLACTFLLTLWENQIDVIMQRFLSEKKLLCECPLRTSKKEFKEFWKAVKWSVWNEKCRLRMHQKAFKSYPVKIYKHFELKALKTNTFCIWMFHLERNRNVISIIFCTISCAIVYICKWVYIL